MQKTAQAANAVRGTVKMARGAAKVGKSIAAAAKGASAGGIYGAIAAFAWENRKLIAKITVAVTAVLLIPVLIICMLPSVIFDGLERPYSLDDPDALLLNDSTVITDNIEKISASLGSVMNESKAEVLKKIEKDFERSDADHMEIIDSHESLTDQNVMSFVAQYSASKYGDYRSVSIADMESIVKEHRDDLYTYTKVTEDRTTIVYRESVDPDTGETVQTETEVTEKWAVYTVVYGGANAFADSIFKLSEEEKMLAKDYEENLKLFLSDPAFQS